MTFNCVKLRDGSKIPSLGLGTFRSEGESLAVAIRTSIKCGYRHFDSAQFYQNENIIGDELKKCIEESNNELKREDFYLVSKIWSTYHSKKRVKESLKETLKNFKVDYLDLLLIHWPMGFKEYGELMPIDSKGQLEDSGISYVETYKAMEELVSEGKVKSIGVSNFNKDQLKDILDNCDIKPAVNQIEIHPYNQNIELVDFCHENQIAVEAYAPIGAGRVKDIYTQSCGLLDDKRLIEIGKKYKKTVAQVCLRWGIQKGLIVIPKSVTPSRIIENSQIFDFELSEEDMKTIQSLNKDLKVYQIGLFKTHKLYPYEK